MKRSWHKPVVIFGNVGRAKLVAWQFQNEGFEVAAFTVNKKYITGPTFYDKPQIPFEQLTELYPPEEFDFYAAIGAMHMNTLRYDIFSQAINMGYQTSSLVSSKAIVFEGFSIPKHCIIGDGSIIQPFVQLGDNTVVAGGVLISHDTVVGENTFIAAGAVIGGGVTIQKNCFIGTGAVVRSKLVLGEKTIVGAGVTLLESTLPGSVYMNTSAQKLPISSDSITF
jgi:sugar O-acyltransferase (sialic acid O-acetyltransferase NeuD family)